MRIGGCRLPKTEGPRGHRSRHIHHRTVQGIYRAFDFAIEVGRPLNWLVVVRARDDGSGNAAPTVMRQIVHKYRDWLCRLTRHGKVDCKPIYVVTIENPPGSIAHANWAVHVPLGREEEFGHKLNRLWAKRALGIVGPGDVHIQPIVNSHMKRLAKYMTKGVDPAYAAHFYLEELISDQGEVVGKRAGASVAIGTRARNRADFRPPPRAHLYGPRRPRAAAGTPAGLRPPFPSDP